MRTLVEICKDIRELQHEAYDRESMAMDPYVESWEYYNRYEEENDYHEKYSELRREFDKVIGFFETDEFASTGDIVLNAIQKHLDYDQLQNNFFDIQEYLELADNPRIEELKEIIDDMKHY